MLAEIAVGKPQRWWLTAFQPLWGHRTQEPRPEKIVDFVTAATCKSDSNYALLALPRPPQEPELRSGAGLRVPKLFLIPPTARTGYAIPTFMITYKAGMIFAAIAEIANSHKTGACAETELGRFRSHCPPTALLGDRGPKSSVPEGADTVC